MTGRPLLLKEWRRRVELVRPYVAGNIPARDIARHTRLTRRQVERTLEFIRDYYPFGRLPRIARPCVYCGLPIEPWQDYKCLPDGLRAHLACAARQ